MYRVRINLELWKRQSPHKRGDVPFPMTFGRLLRGISPQAWGCTRNERRGIHAGVNLPTSVGMYRVAMPRGGTSGESPHKRGDVPRSIPIFPNQIKISPQAWGCTGAVVRHVLMTHPIRNLPTSVGMYPRTCGMPSVTNLPTSVGMYRNILREI